MIIPVLNDRLCSIPRTLLVQDCPKELIQEDPLEKLLQEAPNNSVDPQKGEDTNFPKFNKNICLQSIFGTLLASRLFHPEALCRRLRYIPYWATLQCRPLSATL